MEFQFLIGRLAIDIADDIVFGRLEFQFLIGRLAMILMRA